MQTNGAFPTSDQISNGEPGLAESLIHNAEDLLRSTAEHTTEGLAAARTKFQDSVARAKVKMGDTTALVTNKAGEAATVAQEYVAQNPWKALAIIGFAGIIVGMLMGRRP